MANNSSFLDCSLTHTQLSIYIYVCMLVPWSPPKTMWGRSSIKFWCIITGVFAVISAATFKFFQF
ncbi:hypothetical protein ACU8KH_00455 [Lachancea thermotolerans]